MRKRLTSRYNVKAESRKDGLFPGDVGRPEREDFYYDEGTWDNYEFLPHWDLPDENDIDDKRDEVGFGIPRKAKRNIAAMAHFAVKAAEIAQELLGDDAKEEDVVAQTEDLMKMGSRGIMATLKRIRKAAEEQLEPVAGEDENAECKDGECNKQAEEETEQPVAEEGIEEGIEDLAAEEEEIVQPEAEEEESIEQAEKPVAEEGELPVEGGNADNLVISFDKGDVELDGCEAAAPDPELESLLMGNAPEEQPAQPKVARKKGIKRIACAQPKLHTSNADNAVPADLRHLFDNINIPNL